MANTEAPRARRHRWKVIAGLAVATVAVLVLAVVVFVLVNPSYVAQQVSDRALPRIEERIGREVAVGDIEVSFFPPGVKLEDVSIAGAEGEPPLLLAEEARASIAIWPLLRSRGQEILVKSVGVRDVTVNVVRQRDGTWSHDEVRERLRRTAPPEASTREVVLAEATLRNGRVYLVDGAARADDPDARALLLDQFDATLRNVAPGRPLSVNVVGALASAQRNLEAIATIDPLPKDLAALDPAHFPQLTGRITLTDAQLHRFEGALPAKLTALVSGGLVDLNATISTDESRRYAVDGTARLDSLRLRGQPASGSFLLATRYDPARPQSLSVRLTDLRVNGPGVDLSGDARLAHRPDRIEFALEGPLLDLDALLGTFPKAEGADEREASAGLVPPTMRRRVEGLFVDGRLAVKRVRSGRFDAENLDAHTRMKGGVLTVTRGQATVYDGRVALDGTRIDLLADKPEWNLRAKVEGLDLGRAMQALSGQPALGGRLSASLDLDGAGDVWAEVQKNLTGGGKFALDDGALTTADLGAELSQPLAAALNRLGKKGVAQKIAKGAGTKLRDLAGRFEVKDGWLDFGEPIAFEAPFGTVELGGRLGLDRRLDLKGTANLAPSFLASVSENRLQPRSPVPVPLRLGGSLQDPAVGEIDPAELAKQLALSQKAPQQLEEKARDVEKRAKKRLGDFLRGL